MPTVLTVGVERVVRGRVEDLYDVYHNVENHPKWSTKIVSVVYTDAARKHSIWSIKRFGIFSFKFEAFNILEERPSRIEFCTYRGQLKFHGEVDLAPHSPECGEEALLGLGGSWTLMKLKVTFNVPFAVAAVLPQSWILRIVRRALEKDLRLFDEFMEREREAGSSGGESEEVGSLKDEQDIETPATAATRPET